jgi:hypothetical protein
MAAKCRQLFATTPGFRAHLGTLVAALKAENGELDFPVKPFQPFIANYLTGHRLATAMTEEKTSISPRFQPKCDYSIQGHAFR